MLLEVKQAYTADVLFFHEASVTATVEDVLRELVDLRRLTLRCERLGKACEELAQFGVVKEPDNIEGLVSSVEALSLSRKADDEPLPPLVYRTGHRAEEQAVEQLRQSVGALTAVTRLDTTGSRTPIHLAGIEEALAKVRDAVTHAFPMGLPEHDPVRRALEDREDLTDTPYAKQILSYDTATLWWAGKELQLHKSMADYVGHNEKTKIVLKLHRRGAGPPLREKAIDESTQKEMMAHFFRKQEEQKKLEVDNDDAYLDSHWANPRALKDHFTGIGEIRWKHQ